MLTDYKRRYPWVWNALAGEENTGPGGTLGLDVLLPGVDQEAALEQVGRGAAAARVGVRRECLCVWGVEARWAWMCCCLGCTRRRRWSR